MEINALLAEKGLFLKQEDGLCLADSNGQILKGDFTRLLPRVKQNNLTRELIVKAARMKGCPEGLTVLDATAGLGEDSFLLAAAGFRVTLYEKNPVIFQLLTDAMARAGNIAELAPIVARMQAIHQDSVTAMQTLPESPDVILLDPMFPKRQKNALVKKKLQMIQKLEMPCTEEGTLLWAAVSLNPKKLVIKRPPKGPFLADIQPDYSLQGKAVRFDCFVNPYGKVAHFIPCTGQTDL